MSQADTLNVDLAELQAYLHEHIPLTRAMEVSVVEADGDRVLLRAPLGPNINHRETVFGGSASALAILAGWTYVHVGLRETGHPSRRIVIHRNEMEYARPIHGEFVAECPAPSPAKWDRFLRIIERGRMARLSLSVELRSDDEVVGRFRGDYVAMDSSAE